MKNSSSKVWKSNLVIQNIYTETGYCENLGIHSLTFSLIHIHTHTHTHTHSCEVKVVQMG
jgi:hypothetical protein